jgi:hypothetical protein
MLHIPPRLCPGNPLADAVGQRGATVQTHADLAANPRPAARHARTKADVQFPRCGFHQTAFDCDSCGAQLVDPLTRHQRIRVLHRDDDARDTSRDQRIGARRCAPEVRTRFKRNVSRSAAHLKTARPGINKRLYLCVILACGLRVPLSHDNPVAHQHATDARVRAGGIQTALGQPQRLRHPAAVCGN